jgi:hypothetical protein
MQLDLLLLSQLESAKSISGIFHVGKLVLSPFRRISFRIIRSNDSSRTEAKGLKQMLSRNIELQRSKRVPINNTANSNEELKEQKLDKLSIDSNYFICATYSYFISHNQLEVDYKIHNRHI